MGLIFFFFLVDLSEGKKVLQYSREIKFSPFVEILPFPEERLFFLLFLSGQKEVKFLFPCYPSRKMDIFIDTARITPFTIGYSTPPD